MRSKLKLDDLRKIVKEELSTLREGVDHEGATSVVTTAGKFMSAVEAFKSKMSSAQGNATNVHLAALERALEDMIQTPGSYVDKPKIEPKKVSLRAVKSDD